MSASKTQTSNFRFNVLSDGVKLNEKDDQDNYMDGFLDEMSVWENLSMFTRE